MKRYTLDDFFTDLLLGLGFVLLLSPLFLYWFIHGSYYRHIWVLSGPYPFNALGGGPFQLLFYGVLVISGLAFIIISVLVKRSKKNSKYWY